MTCPRCQDNLRQAQRMGVEIDFCPRCRGVWLDGGELEKIIERSQDILPPEYSQQDYRPHEDRRPQEPYRGERDQPDRAYDDRRYDDKRYDDRERRYDERDDRYRHGKKKKGFLGELFDIFD